MTTQQRKRNAQTAASLEAAVRQAAALRGLTLKVAMMAPNCPHWQFNDQASGYRVLDYWPSNANTRAPATERRQRVLDAWHALSLAWDAALEMRRNQPAGSPSYATLGRSQAGARPVDNDLMIAPNQKDR